MVPTLLFKGRRQSMSGTVYAGILVDEGGAVYNVKHPDFGAKGDGVTDDTAAVQLAAAALQQTGGVLFFPPGTYRVDATQTTPLCAFNSLAGVEVVGFGATLSLQRSMAASEYVDLFRFTGCSNVRVAGFRGIAASHPGGTRDRGPHLVRLLGGCRNVSVQEVELDNFGSVLTARANRHDTDSQRSSGIVIHNARLTNCVYGVSCQFSGNNLTVRGLVADGCLRSYFAYGVRQQDVEVESRNNRADDVVLGNYEGSALEDVRLAYTNVASSQALSAAACIALGPGDSTPAVFRNLRISANIKWPATGYFGYGIRIVKYAQSLGDFDTIDRGHTFENVEISGSFRDSPDLDRYPIKFDGTWGAGEIFRNWSFRNITMVNTASSEIFLDGIRDNAVIQNLSSDGAVYLRGGSGGRVTVLDCTAPHLCASATDASRIDYLNCTIGSTDNQSFTNKTFYNTQVGTSVYTTPRLFSAMRVSLNNNHQVGTDFTKILHDGYHVDTHGRFDSTDKQFVALVSGYYEARTLVTFNASAGQRIGTAVVKNGSDRIDQCYTHAATSGLVSAGGASIVYLSAGDTLDHRAFTSTAMTPYTTPNLNTFEVLYLGS
jgi:hypothetical protein